MFQIIPLGSRILTVCTSEPLLTMPSAAIPSSGPLFVYRTFYRILLCIFLSHSSMHLSIAFFNRTYLR